MTALDELEEIKELVNNDKHFKYKNIVNFNCESIEESIKALEIIKEYQVDVWLLKQCDYKNYIRIRKEAMVSVGQIVNENGIILEDEIPEEEFNILKEKL